MSETTGKQSVTNHIKRVLEGVDSEAKSLTSRILRLFNSFDDITQNLRDSNKELERVLGKDPQA